MRDSKHALYSSTVDGAVSLVPAGLGAVTVQRRTRPSSMSIMPRSKKTHRAGSHSVGPAQRLVSYAHTPTSKGAQPLRLFRLFRLFRPGGMTETATLPWPSCHWFVTDISTATPGGQARPRSRPPVPPLRAVDVHVNVNEINPPGQARWSLGSSFTSRHAWYLVERLAYLFRRANLPLPPLCASFSLRRRLPAAPLTLDPSPPPTLPHTPA